MGKCPNCKSEIEHVIGKSITVGLTVMPAGAPAVAYICPACHTVITVGPDPESVQQDTVAAISRKIDDLVALVTRQTKR